MRQIEYQHPDFPNVQAMLTEDDFGNATVTFSGGTPEQYTQISQKIKLPSDQVRYT